MKRVVGMSHWVPRSAICAAAAVLVLAAGLMPAPGEARTGPRTAEDLLVVDCLLPGQVRKLGRQATFMSARRPIRTTQADCEIRGGEFTSYDRANYQTALKVWMDQAMAGSAEAQNYVGEIYSKGLGTPPDYDMAALWFKKAAEQGFKRAKINLGYLYEQGLGVSKDLAQALNLYRDASGITGDDIVFTSTVQVQMEAKEAEISGLKQTVEQQQEESSALREQVKRLQGQLDNRRAALQQSERELGDLRRKLDEARAVSSEARKQEDWQLMKLLENQLAAKETEIRDQQVQIVALETQVGGGAGVASGGALAAAIPMLELIDPPLTATRGRPAAVLRRAAGTQDLVGRVSAPQGVKAVRVNGADATLAADGVFRTKVDVAEGGTLVSVAAIDSRGVEAKLDFMMIPQSGATAAAPMPASAPSGALPAGVKLGRYHAIVIGNDAYGAASGYAPLQSAVNDATAVAQLLRSKYNYKTKLLLNATRFDILSALNEMREGLTAEDNLLLYYAGHGEIAADGAQGYWIPVDAQAGATGTWISNGAVSEILDTMQARHVLVVADSCYSGAMTRSAVATFDSGVMPADKWSQWVRTMAEGRSRTALTSGGVQPVPDVGSGKHSYFARAFLNVLEDNNRLLEAQRLFREVSGSLALAAVNAPVSQIPEYSPIRFAGHEAGDFFFLRKSAGATGP